jgi:tyrosyl-tRNA synthetase
MTEYKSDFLRTLHERGFIHQCTHPEPLDARLKKERIVAYCGFDATAPSLHVGSLIPIMVLRWLQKTGHKPIILLGGGTTKVGDPSGKDEARKLLTPLGNQKQYRFHSRRVRKFPEIRFGPDRCDYRR